MCMKENAARPFEWICLNWNLPACLRVLWTLLVRSCTVCFVFVLSILSPWRGFLPRLSWTQPPPQLCPCLVQHRLGFAHFAIISMVVSVSCCVCHRFAPSLLISNAWSTGFFVEHLYGLFQSRSQYDLFQNPGLHTCFGSNLNRGLNKNNVLASKPFFAQRTVLHKNCVIHKHHVLHKNHVLAGPVQRLFAAYKIALSMVAGGTRRRRLNKLPFYVADFLTAAYHDLLARMRHNRSTTFSLTSQHISVNITLLVPCLPNTKCHNRTRLGWATLQPSDWTSLPRSFLACSCPWEIIYLYIYIYVCVCVCVLMMNEPTYLYLPSYISIYLSSTCIDTCMYVYIYICMYNICIWCVYICVYIYI